jgi:hypothetical protein
MYVDSKWMSILIPNWNKIHHDPIQSNPKLHGALSVGFYLEHNRFNKNREIRSDRANRQWQIKHHQPEITPLPILSPSWRLQISNINNNIIEPNTNNQIKQSNQTHKTNSYPRPVYCNKIYYHSFFRQYFFFFFFFCSVEERGFERYWILFSQLSSPRFDSIRFVSGPLQ